MQASAKKIFFLLAIVVLLFSCKDTLATTEEETSDDLSYSVTYKPNGSTSGSVPVDSSKYSQGKTVTVLGKQNLVKTGCTFDSWNTKADGSGTKRLPGTTFVMGGENVVLYAQWTVSSSLGVVGVTGGSNNSGFRGMTTDSAGNIYLVGDIEGTSTFNFGTVFLVGANPSGSNGFIIKYNSLGVPQWGKVASMNGSTVYYDVAVDSAGNVYVAGNVMNIGTATFNGTNISFPSSNGNAVLVKYDSSGNYVWATYSSDNTDGSEFSGVAVDSSDNIYAVGYQTWNSTCTYPGSVTITGPTTASTNAIVLKFNSVTGNAVWGKTLTSAGGNSVLSKVAVDPSGNIYAVGYQVGTLSYDYGTGSITGNGTSDVPVIVKYNTNGIALWSKTTTSASGTCTFTDVAVAPSGARIYAVGYQFGNGTFDYGDGAVSNALSLGNNGALIVCYTSGGGVDWGQVASSDLESMFYSVAVDSAETVYAAGNLTGDTAFTFGLGTTVAASGNSSTWQASSLLLKFNTAGAASWARVYGSTLGGESSSFYGVSAASNYVYAGGTQYGTNEFKEGTSTYNGPAAANNATFVKFSR